MSTGPHQSLEAEVLLSEQLANRLWLVGNQAGREDYRTRAVRLLEDSLAIREATGNAPVEGMIKLGVLYAAKADLFGETSDWLEAERWLTRAVERAEGDPEIAYSAKSQLKALYLRLGRTDEASALQEELEELLKQFGQSGPP